MRTLVVLSFLFSLSAYASDRETHLLPLWSCDDLLAEQGSTVSRVRKLERQNVALSRYVDTANFENVIAALRRVYLPQDFRNREIDRFRGYVPISRDSRARDQLSWFAHVSLRILERFTSELEEGRETSVSGGRSRLLYVLEQAWESISAGYGVGYFQNFEHFVDLGYRLFIDETKRHPNRELRELVLRSLDRQRIRGWVEAAMLETGHPLTLGRVLDSFFLRVLPNVELRRSPYFTEIFASVVDLFLYGEYSIERALDLLTMIPTTALTLRLGNTETAAFFWETVLATHTESGASISSIVGKFALFAGLPGYSPEHDTRVLVSHIRLLATDKGAFQYDFRGLVARADLGVDDIPLVIKGALLASERGLSLEEGVRRVIGG